MNLQPDVNLTGKKVENKMNYQEQLNKLFEIQRKEWDLLRRNLEGLESAKIREFSFEDYLIKVQFNHKRIISSSAKVDKDSINKRECFLCESNRPLEQKRVLYRDKYEFLCNPFPIFRKHFTISSLKHSPQKIKGYFTDFLQISRDLPELIVFYNAPACGASAPDHLHFQAGNYGLMPVTEEIEKLKKKYGKKIINKEDVEITAVDDDLRRFVLLESDDPEKLNEIFNQVHSFCSELKNGGEPMLNILSTFRESWQVFVFLREIHRPWQFFEEGNENILLSPASVDFGGTMITPLEKDFNKIKNEDIRDIFQQVSLSKAKFRSLMDFLNQKALQI